MLRNSPWRAWSQALLAAVLFAPAFFACGGRVGAAPGGSAGSSGGGGSSSGASSSGGNGGLIAACPPSPPQNGAACAWPGAEEALATCEYGGDPDLACNTLSICTNGQWVTTPPTPTEGCPTSKPGSNGCPSAYPVAEAACTGATVCGYPDGLCVCASSVWQCEALIPGCPEPRPPAGAPCGGLYQGVSQGSKTCNYAGCVFPSGGVEMYCVTGNDPSDGGWIVAAAARCH